MASSKSKQSSGTVGATAVESKSDSEVSTLASDVQTLAAYSQKTWVNGETIYDTDLNHMERGIADAQSTADSAQSTADSAQSTADAAASTASDAQSTAKTASNAASTAQSAATAAQSTANEALETANAAKTTADSAEKSVSSLEDIVEEAADTASAAKATANSAEKTANEALEAANDAQAVAKSAATVADEAEAAVESITGDVNEAREEAEQAAEVARVANETADAAQQTATNANTAATAAQSTANEALSKVATAQTAADNAQYTADSAAQAAQNALDSIPTKVSALDNDVPYVKEEDLDSLFADTLTGVSVNGVEQETLNRVANIDISGLGGVSFAYDSTSGATDATKVITCSGIESIYDGVTICIFFSQPNRVPANLNVNSLGSFPIATNPSEGTGNVYWADNTLILFSFSLNCWVPISSNDSGYVECDTAADEQEKKLETTGNLTIKNGSRITVLFKNENSAEEPTLYFANMLEAFEIEGNTNWNAGDYVDFVFDGQKWISLYK